MKSVFIDGKAGTTGLRIFERLGKRDDIELLTLPDSERKSSAVRKEIFNRADIVFLCLPDEAAIEAAGFVENDNTVIIDTSTAHRTDPAWTYGFPEIYQNADQMIKNSKRISVPGCHASGFIALVKPLLDADLLGHDVRLTCHSLTGYSGGGKQMIAQYEGDGKDKFMYAPREYALGQNHKHLREMTTITNLNIKPIFCPIVDDFYSGMMITVPLFAEDIADGETVESIKNTYRKLYTGPVVKYVESEETTLSALDMSGSDGMKVSVLGNDERILLVARYDNLGKGASGAAIQLLNILMGENETKNLEL